MSEGQTGDVDIARRSWTPRGQRPRARTETPCPGTGRSCGHPRRMAPGVVSGSLRTHADDERPQEVGQVCKTDEVSEQGRASGGGGGGGKGSDQGEPASAKRVSVFRFRIGVSPIRSGGLASSPEARAGCGKSARPGLCRGLCAIMVPTATAPTRPTGIRRIGSRRSSAGSATASIGAATLGSLEQVGVCETGPRIHAVRHDQTAVVDSARIRKSYVGTRPCGLKELAVEAQGISPCIHPPAINAYKPRARVLASISG